MCGIIERAERSPSFLKSDLLLSIFEICDAFMSSWPLSAPSSASQTNLP